MTPNNLKHYRLKRNLTQQEAAERIGHSSANRLSTWENGSASPSVQNLMKLAELYGVSIDTLVTPRSRKARRVKKQVVKNPGMIGKYAEETMQQQKFILMSHEEKIDYLAELIVEVYFDSKENQNQE